MKKPLFAIPSFPGSNGEVDNVKTLKRCGFDCFVFRWNDSLEKLKDVDGYFFGAGFSYEDRGRSGMVAARDPLFEFMRREAEREKVIIGNCNGAQVLVESGLIPLGDGLKMCLAHNALKNSDGSYRSPGFLNEWVWITPACKKDRCATSNWSGALHIPIAHGEGRFVTRDPDLISQLKKEDQIAFQYCDEQGIVDEASPVTPNGSTLAIAGICNREGNVVALMPHPERTPLGDPYFLSILQWMKKRSEGQSSAQRDLHVPQLNSVRIEKREPLPVEIFIDTVITNNEERTVEQAARRIVPEIVLKQYRYIGLHTDTSKELFSKLSFFNPNKEIAYMRLAGVLHRWDAPARRAIPLSSNLFSGTTLLRRDLPDMTGASIGAGVETGICYDCRSIDPEKIRDPKLCEVLCNPHSSTLEVMTA